MFLFPFSRALKITVLHNFVFNQLPLFLSFLTFTPTTTSVSLFWKVCYDRGSSAWRQTTFERSSTVVLLGGKRPIGQIDTNDLWRVPSWANSGATMSHCERASMNEYRLNSTLSLSSSLTLYGSPLSAFFFFFFHILTSVEAEIYRRLEFKTSWSFLQLERMGYHYLRAIHLQDQTSRLNTWRLASPPSLSFSLLLPPPTHFWKL